MKNLLTLSAFILLLNGLSAQPNDAGRLEWLCGTWQNISTGEFEQWSRGDDGIDLIGLGFALSGKDTIINERMMISNENGKSWFIADVPQNQTLVRFEISSSTANEFYCTNPEHDFPKFIRYTLTSEDSLHAEIGDYATSFQFRFVRLKQE